VRNLIVSVEAYPDLKSNQNFLELQRQLAETEDRIAAGRRFYNANVRVYNTKIESVPTNIIANMFNFEKATYFQVDEPAVRQAPDVNFGEIAYRGDQDQRQLPPQQAAPPVQFDDRQGDLLPNPQEYQQPPQGYQPPRQGGSQAPPPQPGGYMPPETGPQNPNQR
jgi:LemA protein